MHNCSKESHVSQDRKKIAFMSALNVFPPLSSVVHWKEAIGTKIRWRGRGGGTAGKERGRGQMASDHAMSMYLLCTVLVLPAEVVYSSRWCSHTRYVGVGHARILIIFHFIIYKLPDNTSVFTVCQRILQNWDNFSDNPVSLKDRRAFPTKEERKKNCGFSMS